MEVTAGYWEILDTFLIGFNSAGDPWGTCQPADLALVFFDKLFNF